MRLIKRSGKSTKLYINKLAVAERQLGAAIRLFFMEEDELAIHTIASAAYNVYADLLKVRGKEEWKFPLEYGILRAAYDLAHGELDKSELIAEFGNDAASVILKISDSFSENPVLVPEDVTLVGVPESLRSDWHDLRRPANFLKHADKDHAGLLDTDSLETEEIILRAINASLHLNADFTKEKEFFYSAMYALGKMKDPPKKPLLIWVLTAYEPEEIMQLGRQNLCDNLDDSDIEIDHDRAKMRMKNPYEVEP